jgi:formamidopyrimidine-DNA glycosylase
LWRTGLDPAQPAGKVTDTDAARLLDTLGQVLTDFLRDGGSHTGHLHESRIRGGQCPQDGQELERRTIGGRTTYSCPLHQRISG